jgi:regulator of sigma E protease
MEILHTLFYFIVGIGLLVAIHEWGHFWVARKTGVKVLRFSIGFGKVIWKYQKDKNSTEYVLSLIPLGGYVKMVDEREGEVTAKDLPYAFTQKPLWVRFAIIAAGPLFNLILAIFLYTAVFMIGETGRRPIVGEISSMTLVGQAGFVEGEEIISINDITTHTWRETMETLIASISEAEEGLVVGVKTADGQLLTHTLVIPPELSHKSKHLFKKLGLKAWQPIIPVIVGKIIMGGAAEQAGLQVGDLILRADEVNLESWSVWVKYIQSHAGKNIQLLVKRNGEQFPLFLTPKSVVQEERVIGKIGAGVYISDDLRDSLMVEYSLSAVDAFSAAIQRTGYYSLATLKMMGAMFTGNSSMDNLSGPISIAQYAGKSAEMGMVAFLKFLAIVSISLGVLNLLPIPVLDGGHLLMFVVEAIKGSPVTENIQIAFQQVGMAALLALMVLAMVLDVGRLF